MKIENGFSNVLKDLEKKVEKEEIIVEASDEDSAHELLQKEAKERIDSIAKSIFRK